MAHSVEDDVLEESLSAVGPRLRKLRRDRSVTLADLADTTGISRSTLSRLESGHRRATLEILLRLARAYDVPIDELVSTSRRIDPRVKGAATRINGMTVIPLSRREMGVRSFKHLIGSGKTRRTPELGAHDGYEWLFVLSGRLRLVLGDQDIVLESGEAAEFDTRTPHWFGGADANSVEFLSLYGPQGQRMHVRATDQAIAKPGRDI